PRPPGKRAPSATPSPGWWASPRSPWWRPSSCCTWSGRPRRGASMRSTMVTPDGHGNSRLAHGGRLAGKVAIVSGGGTSAPPAAGVGVGRAITLAFGRAGAAVVIVDRDARAARETLSAAREEGIAAIVVQADVASAEQCDRVAAVAREVYGG